MVEVVSESGGVADLDTDGDGFANTPAELATLGITTDEQTTLASLYDPGDELRRYTTTHFSWGCPHKENGVPADARDPGQPLGDDGSGNDCGCTGGGSIIRSDRQVWGEAVDLVGSPFDLHYESDRVPGYKPSYTLNFPITDADPIPSLVNVVVQIKIAGQVHNQSFSGAPNQTGSFTWDGLDVFGRKLQGRHPAKVRIIYGYTPPGPGFRAFGVTQQTYVTNIGNWDNRFAGLGGWSLSSHHGYDPRARVLYRGDGERRQAGDLPNTLDLQICDGTSPASTASGFCTGNAQYSMAWGEWLGFDQSGTLNSRRHRGRKRTPFPALLDASPWAPRKCP